MQAQTLCFTVQRREGSTFPVYKLKEHSLGEEFEKKGQKLQFLEGTPYLLRVMGRHDPSGHCGLRPWSSSNKLSESSGMGCQGNWVMWDPSELPLPLPICEMGIASLISVSKVPSSSDTLLDTRLAKADVTMTWGGKGKDPDQRPCASWSCLLGSGPHWIVLFSLGTTDTGERPPPGRAAAQSCWCDPAGVGWRLWAGNWRPALWYRLFGSFAKTPWAT